MSVRGLKQIYKYGDENLSITDLLEKKEVVNYLKKAKELTYASLREKLRKELRKHGNDLRELVANYNLPVETAGTPKTRVKCPVETTGRPRQSLRSATSKSKSSKKGYERKRYI